MIRINNILNRDEEIDWVAVLRLTYPDKVIGVVYWEESSDNTRFLYGHELPNAEPKAMMTAELLAPITTKPYYTKVMASILSRKGE